MCRISLSNCSIIGQSHSTALHLDVRTAICDKYGHDVAVASFFHRAVINRDTYYSQAYQRRNSYTVSYVDGGTVKYGFIQHFLSFSFECVAVIKPLIPTTCYPQQLHPLQKCVVPVYIC